MSYFFQIVVSGVVVGSIYALAALGLVLVYKSSRGKLCPRTDYCSRRLYNLFSNCDSWNPDFLFIPGQYDHNFFPCHEC